MSSNQAGPIAAVELQGAAADSDESAVQVDGAHRALHEMVARGGSFSGRERNCAYLNTRDGRFAAAASAVGFDFLDDARAVVTLDYDGDGDVDVITTNRTAPRLRILLNRSERLAEADRSRSVTLLLEGARPGDAIGATVELRLPDAPPIVRTVAAGASFLGASSLRLTIGVGQASRIEDILVTWPGMHGAGAESFGALSLAEEKGSQAFRVVRDASRLEPIDLPQCHTPPGTSPRLVAAFDGPGCAGDAVSAFLAIPEPVPPIERDGEPFAWRDADLEPHALVEPMGAGVSGAPAGRVVTLWSLDCPLCGRELQEWQAYGASFPTLALSIDQVMAQAAGEIFDLDRFDEVIRHWPDPSPREIQFGHATYELLEALQAAVDHPFARDEDLTLPATFVFDALGRLTAVHRGQVNPSVIEAELEFLASDEADDPVARRQRAVPFDGRWLAPPPNRSAVAQARAWLDAGAAEAAAAMLLQAAEAGEITANSKQARPASRAAAEAANMLYKKGDLAQAIPAANLTTQLRPDWAKGHFNRATILDAAGLVEEADAAYSRVLELRGNHWQALANRGLLRGKSGRVDDGRADLEQALRALPRSASPERRAQIHQMIEALKNQ